MSEWKLERIGRLTSLIKDGTHGSFSDVSDGIPLLSAKDIEFGVVAIPEDCRKISEKSYNSIHSTYELLDGDVLLTIVGTIGRAALYKDTGRKLTFQRSVGILRPDQRKIIPPYFYYYTQSDYFQSQLESFKNASAQGGVYLGSIAKIKVHFPVTLSEQSKIARILSTVDEVIERTEAAIAKYQAIKHGMMHDLFTRGLDQNGTLRPKFDDAPELYHKTKLGWLPKEWEVSVLHKVAQIRTGIALNSKRKFTDPITAHYLRVANVQDGYLDLSEMRTIQVERSDLERYRVIKNDVLMNEGGDLDKLGRGSLWDGQYEPCVHQNHVFVVRCTSFILPTFLNKWTETPTARQYFMVAGKQTTNLASINKTQLGKLPIAIPPLPEQIRMVRVMASCENQEKTEVQQVEKFKLIKQGLMQALLTGRKTVTIDKTERDN